MDFVSELNKQGASFLRQGLYKEALNMFRGSLHQLQTLIDGAPSTEFKTTPPSKANATRDHQPNNCFAHTEVIEIPSITQVNDEELFDVASSIVLFNMALAYHLHCCTNPAKMENLSKNAMQLYQLSVQNNEGLYESPDDYCRSTSAFLSIAALNNMGHILHELGQYEESRLAFDQMNLCITSTGVEANEYYKDFLLNSILLTEPDLAAAA